MGLWSHIWLLTTVWLLWTACVAPAQSLPATTQAVELDLSTPGTAMRTFVAAVLAGDLATAKEAAWNDPAQSGLVEAIVGMGRGFSELAAAIPLLPGTSSADWAQAGSPLQWRRLEDGPWRIEGDQASLLSRNQRESVALRRVDGRWKVVAASLFDGTSAADQMALCAALGQAAAQTAQEIRDRKAATVQEARNALSARLTAILTTHLTRSATTQPTTREERGD